MKVKRMQEDLSLTEESVRTETKEIKEHLSKQDRVFNRAIGAILVIQFIVPIIIALLKS